MCDDGELTDNATDEAIYGNRPDALEMVRQLLKKRWDSDYYEEGCKSGSLVERNRVPTFDHKVDSDFFEGRVPEDRLAEIPAGADLTRDEEVDWTRDQLAAIIDRNQDHVLHKSWGLEPVRHGDGRTAWVLVLWNNYPPSPASPEVVEAYVSLGQARRALRTRGIFDPDDYKGREEVRRTAETS